MQPPLPGCARPDLKPSKSAALSINEVSCKSLLSRSGISGVDFCINPYTGCLHNCIYCYAIYMRRYSGHRENWGQFVDIKINAIPILRKELLKTVPGLVMLSTVTDAYQPLEKKYQITRACLEELSKTNFTVTILTKSDLILRDIDLLKKCQTEDVGFTITTPDEEIRRKFEPHSSSTERRLAALRKLAESGVRTFVFFGPVLPYFSDREEKIEALFQKLKDAKVPKVLVDTMNFRKDIWVRFKDFLQKYFPESLEYYFLVLEDESYYAAELKDRITHLANKFKLGCEFCF